MSSEIVKNLLLEDKKLREENKKLRKEIEDKLIEKLEKRIKKKKKEIGKLRKIKFKIESKTKPKFKPKKKTKSKSKSKSKSKQNIKTFDDYYQECIKGKDIPKDAPEYFKEALGKAKKEYEKGIILEKSALANFAEKYVIEGKPGLFPMEYFGEKAHKIKDFLRKYRNTKVRFVLVCEMERQFNYKDMESKKFFERDFAYFQSKTKINLESTNVKKILKEMIKEILNTLSIYQKNGSGWYFKEVIRLEIHIVEYKLMKGGFYLPLPEFIQKKKAIINIKNEDDKCFLWSVLRYLHPKEIHGEIISDLEKYENDLNFKEINFPVKVKDIRKFEKQNPDLPQINIFSLNENNKVYPLRIKQKNCQKTIDLFLYSDGEKQHYSLTKKKLFKID